MNFDDNWAIFNNPYVQSLNVLNNFRYIYYFDYTPVTTFYFSLVNQLFGMNPFYYHFFNLLLHLLNGILIFKLGRTIFKFDLLAAYFFATIFLIHPMQVESVAWLTEAKNVLSVFFLLLSWLAFDRFKSLDPQQYIFYVASLCLFFLSLGAKTISVTFPLLLIIYYTLQHRSNFSKNLIFQTVPFFGLSLLFSLLRIFANSDKMEFFNSELGLVLLVKNTFIKYLFYFSRSIFPHHLSGYYESGIFQLFWYEYAIVSVFLLLTFLVYKRSQNLSEKQHLLYFFVFTIIALLPVLKIVPFPIDFMVADRYMYFPSIGLYALFAVLLAKLFTIRKLKVFAVFYVMLLTLHLSVLARNRVFVWHNDYNLWTDVLQKYPNTKKGLHNLSVQLILKHKYSAALALQTKLLELEPRNVKNRLNMIAPHFYSGEMEEVIQKIEALEKEVPEHMTIAQILAIIYYQQKEYQKAVKKMKLVLKFDPTHILTHKLLININQQLKDRDIYDYQKNLIEEFQVPIDLPETF
ncbi:MAG: hypothetical protein HOD92_08440 [Deltaproteobacteria bacterium]|nr:hypothetical protein [Deltaproteobacteria bacterium]